MSSNLSQRAVQYVSLATGVALAIGWLAGTTISPEAADTVTPAANPVELVAAPATVHASFDAAFDEMQRHYPVGLTTSRAAPVEAQIESPGPTVFNAALARDTLLAATPRTLAAQLAALAAEPEAQAMAASKMPASLYALAQAGGDQPVELILRDTAGVAAPSDDLLVAVGGERSRTYPALGMRAVTVPADALIALAIDGEIAWLSADADVSGVSTTMHDAASMPSVGSGNLAYDGSGVAVAVVDSGVAFHEDMKLGVIQFDFTNPATVPVDPATGKSNPATEARQDGFGHGTHIAATITGNGFDSNFKFRGFAERADIVSLRVLNNGGQGKTSSVIAALDWLLDNHAQYNVRVVNLSLGQAVAESNTTDPLVLAAERLWDAGLVVVAAAGNDGHAGNMTINSPGNSRKLITVGSLTDNGTGSDFSDDYVSTFSSRGPTVGDLVVKPDLVAPGNKIVAGIQLNSTLASLLPGRIHNCEKTACTSEYLEMSGTSMATGVVSGVVALMLNKDPLLSPDTVKARLMQSARKLADEPTTVGAGVLDVNAALDATGVMSGVALSPIMVRDETSGQLFVQDTGELWGSSEWSAANVYPGAESWAAAESAPGDVGATGFLWTDEGGVEARGFLWTDEDVWARGFLWTDETVMARGFLWTDEDNIQGRSFMTDGNGETVVNDDP